MARWRSPNQREEAPPGEYVVRHERPYPERMERTFRIGAAIFSGTILAIGIVAACYVIYTGQEVSSAVLALATSLMLAVIIYAAIWSIGAVLIGIVIAFRRKQYIVDRDDPAAPARQNRAALLILIAMAAFVLLLPILL